MKRLLTAFALVWIVSPELRVDEVQGYLNRETSIESAGYGIGVTSVTVACYVRNRGGGYEPMCRVWHWKWKK